MRIDFIDVQTGLYTTGATPVFSITDVLAVSNSGQAVCDIYFNQTDFETCDVIIDWSAISPYWDYVAWHIAYPRIWKNGVKIYDGSTLIFTGVIYFDRVKIDTYNYRFAFEATSTAGFFMRANDELKTTLGSDEDGLSFQDFANRLFGKSRSFMFNDAGVALTNLPQFIFDGITIPGGFVTDLVLPNYNDDFGVWQPLIPFLQTVTPRRSYFAIDNFQTAPGANLGAIIFMYKEWYGFDSSNNWYQYENRMRVYRVGYENVELLYELDRVLFPSYTPIDISQHDFTFILYQPQNWEAIATQGNTSYDLGYGVIQADGSTWQYQGITNINNIAINTNQVNTVNPYKELIDLMILKQAALVSLPNGNISCKLRPLLATNVVPFVIDDAFVIGQPIYQGVFVNRRNIDSLYPYMAGSPIIRENINNYYNRIITKFKVRISFVLDTTSGYDLDNGQFIRYLARDYTISKIAKDTEANMITIEAYGEA